MGSIIDILKSIGDAFNSCIDFLVSFIQNIIYIVKLTGEFVITIPEYFDWLPPGVLAIIVSAFAVVVIYKILGREG